jgi:hypothetical protein
MFMVAAVFLKKGETAFSEMPSPHGLRARQTHRKEGRFRCRLSDSVHWLKPTSIRPKGRAKWKTISVFQVADSDGLIDRSI